LTSGKVGPHPAQPEPVDEPELQNRAGAGFRKEISMELAGAIVADAKPQYGLKSAFWERLLPG
jgi:hypothetical protein